MALIIIQIILIILKAFNLLSLSWVLILLPTIIPVLIYAYAGYKVVQLDNMIQEIIDKDK